MFIYLTRKLKMLMNFGYTNTDSMREVVNSELTELEEPIPSVKFTKNPFKCLKDTSEDITYEQSKNKVIICPQLIPSEISLKASLKREKFWIKTRRSKKTFNDDQEAQNVIKACKQELSAFNKLDQATQQQGTKICAKIHAKLKIPNRSNRQLDSWHFYTRKLVDDNFYVYFSE